MSAAKGGKNHTPHGLEKITRRFELPGCSLHGLLEHFFELEYQTLGSFYRVLGLLFRDCSCEACRGRVPRSPFS